MGWMRVFYHLRIIEVLVEVQAIRIYLHRRSAVNRCHRRRIYKHQKMKIRRLLSKFIEVIKRLNISRFIRLKAID